MKEDGSGAPLSRRVPGSARSGPREPARPVFSDTDMHRIHAAIDAEHANTEMPIQGEPNTEPLSRVTDSGPGIREAGHPPAARERAAKAPRAEESLRAAKALQAAEELRAAEKPRAVSPRRAEEAASAAGPLRPEKPVVALEPVHAEEPAHAPELVLVPDPVDTEEPEFAAQPVNTAGFPRRTEIPKTTWSPASAEPAPGTIGWLWPEDTTTQGHSRRWQQPGRWPAPGRWRSRSATLVALGAAVLVAVGLVVGMSLHADAGHAGAHAATSGPGASAHATGTRPGRHATTPSRGGGSAASGSPALTHHSPKPNRTSTTSPAVAANRTAAARWIDQQVSGAAVVACDAQTCAALRNSGFHGNPVQIGPKSTSLSNARLIVVTPELRALITATNKGLGADVASTDLASFGAGNAEVTVQVVYPAGAAAYTNALSQSVQTRMKAGKQLLSTGKVSASAAAERDLEDGAVDPRLMLVIKAMATLEPVDIVGFADSGPGASAGVPFRLMALGESDPAAPVSGSAYLQAMLQLLQAHASFPAFSHVAQTTLSGQKVVQVEYAAPSPLNV